MQVSAACAAAAAAGTEGAAQTPSLPGRLTLNDDGYVFLNMSDNLRGPDLRQYLQSYCRPGVDTVAYCVGDMSWPAFYPTKVGVHYDTVRATDDLRRIRIYKNADNFASEPGGYFGTVFRLLHEFGKKALASFRMNDAHFTSTDNPNVSEFWRQHAEFALGPVYGYYGGCLNYASDVVRAHFVDRVLEFAELYPDIDGIELDAMRSPFFFPPDKGAEYAPLFTEMVRRIKTALAEQAKRLNRPEYLLTANVPLTPELALECGLDTVAWDMERLFDRVSVGTYQAYMDAPLEQWQTVLVKGTPVFAYINCSVQTGQYLGLEEYRAAAANAYGSGADGVYLFNFPCLFELAMMTPSPVEEVPMTLPDMRRQGQPDLSTVGQTLDELGSADLLRGKDKRFLYYFNNDASYRHYSPSLAGMDRAGRQPPLKATFRCFEEFNHARGITLRFKIENVTRTELFQVVLNGSAVDPAILKWMYVANGRDTRIHTVTLGPHFQPEISLGPEHLRHGENVLEVVPLQLDTGLTAKINLAEIELLLDYN
ncbi:MAG: hypothetical protein HYV26_03990 [Candidatus Hydrogenedentes bacterium]|nr:hypothetical protein [Candidatus Hydrogenedentota bacterium]